MGNYNPFSSASSFFLTYSLSTIFCRVFNFWLIFQHFFYFCSSSFFQAFTCPSVPPFILHLTPSCHSPHSVLDPGCLLHSSLCQVSSCRKKHRRGDFTFSVLELITSRAPEGAITTVEVKFCSEILCTEQVQSAGKDNPCSTPKHPLRQKNSALNPNEEDHPNKNWKFKPWLIWHGFL